MEFIKDCLKFITIYLVILLILMILTRDNVSVTENMLCIIISLAINKISKLEIRVRNIEVILIDAMTSVLEDNYNEDNDKS